MISLLFMIGYWILICVGVILGFQVVMMILSRVIVEIQNEVERFHFRKAQKEKEYYDKHVSFATSDGDCPIHSNPYSTDTVH
jgi:hypothetical protein